MAVVGVVLWTAFFAVLLIGALVGVGFALRSMLRGERNTWQVPTLVVSAAIAMFCVVLSALVIHDVLT